MDHENNYTQLRVFFTPFAQKFLRREWFRLYLARSYWLTHRGTGRRDTPRMLLKMKMNLLALLALLGFSLTAGIGCSSEETEAGDDGPPPEQTEEEEGQVDPNAPAE